MKSKSTIVAALVAVGLLAFVGLYYFHDSASDDAIENTHPAKTPTGHVGAMSIPSNRPVRLAIGDLGMASKNEESKIADMLAASLSTNSGFELVERRQLDKALHEAELSAAKMIDPKQAIRLGQLLKADWFLWGAQSKAQNADLLIARIVDTQTGVIGAVTLVPFHERSAPDISRDLTDFVSQTRSDNGARPSQTFLALGNFDDLSIHKKPSDFPAQLKTYLTAHMGQQNVTFLEREQISALMEEMQLGLTSMGGQACPKILSAPWLVSGYYQFSTTAPIQTELILRVDKMGSGQWRRSIKGASNESVFDQASTVIQILLSATHTPSEFMAGSAEANDYMEHGLKVSQLNINHLRSGLDFQMEFTFNRQPNHRQNYLESIEDFQKVLLLNANDSLAKLYLGYCLMAPCVGRQMEARYNFQDVLDNDVREERRFMARLGMVASYAFMGTGKADENELNQGIDLIKSALATETNAPNRRAFQNSLNFFERELESIRNTIINFEGPEFEKKLAGLLQSELEQSRKKNGFSEPYLFDSIRRALVDGTIQDTAWFAPLCQRLCNQFPELKPYILMGFLSRKVGPDSIIAREFCASVDGALANPKKIHCPESYFTQLFGYAWTWAKRNQQTKLMAQMGDARCRAIKEGCAPGLSEDERASLAYAYMAVGRWKEALDQLEPFGYRISQMLIDAPSGYVETGPFVPDLLARECRQHLGIPPKIFPGQFDLPKPIITLGMPFFFLPEGNSIWVVSNSKVSCFDSSGKGQWEKDLSQWDDAEVTCLAQTPEKLWIGTKESGVYEFDKTRRMVTNHYTETDGLLFDKVLAMHCMGKTLFIASGDYEHGGINSLDAISGKITAYVSALPIDSQLEKNRHKRAMSEPTNGPPTFPVLAFASCSPDELWMGISYKGLKKYHLDSNRWETRGISILDHLTSFVVSKEVIVVGDFASTGYDNKLIGLVFSEENQNKPVIFSTADGLPHEKVTALAMDGQYLWVGGWGYLSVLDCQKRKVIKTALLQSNEVRDLFVVGDFVYLRYQNSITRLPRALALGPDIN